MRWHLFRVSKVVCQFCGTPPGMCNFLLTWTKSESERRNEQVFGVYLAKGIHFGLNVWTDWTQPTIWYVIRFVLTCNEFVPFLLSLCLCHVLELLILEKTKQTWVSIERKMFSWRSSRWVHPQKYSAGVVGMTIPIRTTTCRSLVIRDK